MNPAVYFRAIDSDPEEIETIRKHFPVYVFRTDIPRGSLIIPRYTMLPFPDELAGDASNLGCSLINTVKQHRYVSDILNYVEDLGDLTPRTWSNWFDLPDGISFVLKGRTNSRKFEWDSKMFAQTKKDIPRVANALLNDTAMKDQGLVVREYIPLKKLGEGINGLPISNEWRVFVLDGKILHAGFYWASEPELGSKLGNFPPLEALKLVREVAGRVKDKIRFYVVDVAETDSGDWVVIELNDGCMSGLAMIDPGEFYKSLREMLSFRGHVSSEGVGYVGEF